MFTRRLGKLTACVTLLTHFIDEENIKEGNWFVAILAGYWIDIRCDL